MARYIDAVKAAEMISEALKIDISDLCDIFADIPTAVVCCGNCEHLTDDGFCFKNIGGVGYKKPSQDDFCSYGRKKDEISKATDS